MKKNFSDKIKTHAIELGFEKVGISRAESISKEKENLEAWINDNGHASMEWVVKRKKEEKRKQKSKQNHPKIYA